MRKSHGSGPKHALTLGVVASIEKLGDDFGNTRKWLAEEICDICKKETKFYPVRVTAHGEPINDSDEDQGVTAFMCSSCRNPS